MVATRINKEDTMAEKPTDAQYLKAEARIAIDFVPNIYPCNKCGWPVISGYCCTTCGSCDPGEEED